MRCEHYKNFDRAARPVRSPAAQSINMEISGPRPLPAEQQHHLHIILNTPSSSSINTNIKLRNILSMSAV
jgi:hypothetical protein